MKKKIICLYRQPLLSLNWLINTGFNSIFWTSSIFYVASFTSYLCRPIVGVLTFPTNINRCCFFVVISRRVVIDCRARVFNYNNYYGNWLHWCQMQWLKWTCEAGGLTWRSQVGANPIPIPHPTNLALFGHKITLYRFNQGVHTIARGGAQIGAGGWATPSPLTLTTGQMSWDYVVLLFVQHSHTYAYICIHFYGYFFGALVATLNILSCYCYQSIKSFDFRQKSVHRIAYKNAW